MSSSRGRETEGGKGDQLRKVNRRKYDENFDKIFNNKTNRDSKNTDKQTKTLDSGQS